MSLDIFYSYSLEDVYNDYYQIISMHGLLQNMTNYRQLFDMVICNKK